MNNTTEPNWLQLPTEVNYLFNYHIKEAVELAFENPDADYWTINIKGTPVKIANDNKKLPGLLEPVFRPLNTVVNKTVGGYNPLVLALVGSALSGGLGTLGGWLAHKFMPNTIDESAPKRMGIAGALAGLLPGAAFYAAKVPEHGWGGAFTARLGKQGSDEEYDEDFSGVQDAVDYLAKYIHVPTSPYMKKAVDDNLGLFLPRVNVEQWVGTMFKDPYLQVKEKAIAAGMPYAAGLAKHKNFVSPLDVAKIGLGAGVGATSGRLVGSIASGFLGLTPKVRDGIQNMGLLAGAVRSALNVFN